MTKAKGNMYSQISHTQNYIKGKCPHQCSYCYMNSINKRFGITPKEPYLDEKELKVNLGKGNIIFIGSSFDMWAKDIPDEWIRTILNHLKKYPDNTYLFQSKNPKRFIDFNDLLPENCMVGTTIESDMIYPCMNVFIYPTNGKTPLPSDRTVISKVVLKETQKRFVTIEPILNFGKGYFVDIIADCKPDFVNIGADSGNNHLTEPPREKVLEFIAELEKFTTVYKKPNLDRLLRAGTVKKHPMGAK